MMTQIEDLFQSMVSQMLNTTDQGAVRIEWPTGGAPAWPIDYDVCFLSINYDDDTYTQQMHTEYSENDSTTANADLVYTAALRVVFNFVGPNSFDNADLVRSSLFQEPYKTTLAASNLALITNVSMPTRAPELFNGQWWNRTTFFARFYELITRTSTVPYIQTASATVMEG
jgi:hypothetical protein